MMKLVRAMVVLNDQGGGEREKRRTHPAKTKDKN